MPVSKSRNQSLTSHEKWQVEFEKIANARLHHRDRRAFRPPPPPDGAAKDLSFLVVDDEWLRAKVDGVRMVLNREVINYLERQGIRENLSGSQSQLIGAVPLPLSLVTGGDGGKFAAIRGAKKGGVVNVALCNICGSEEECRCDKRKIENLGDRIGKFGGMTGNKRLDSAVCYCGKEYEPISLDFGREEMYETCKCQGVAEYMAQFGGRAPDDYSPYAFLKLVGRTLDAESSEEDLKQMCICLETERRLKNRGVRQSIGQAWRFLYFRECDFFLAFLRQLESGQTCEGFYFFFRPILIVYYIWYFFSTALLLTTVGLPSLLIRQLFPQLRRIATSSYNHNILSAPIATSLESAMDRGAMFLREGVSDAKNAFILLKCIFSEDVAKHEKNCKRLHDKVQNKFRDQKWLPSMLIIVLSSVGSLKQRFLATLWMTILFYSGGGSAAQNILPLLMMGLIYNEMGVEILVMSVVISILNYFIPEKEVYI